MGYASVVYKNGKIYTVNESKPWAEAVAVKDGKFLQVGSDADMDTLAGSNTKVVDLGGKFVMPGVHDAHIHPDWVVDFRLNLTLSPDQSWPEIQQAIKTFAEERPDRKWIWGGGLPWLTDKQIGDFEGVRAHKSVLDELVPDRPVALWDVGGHAALVNSKALEIAGVTRFTKDPSGGAIIRDKNNDATGVMRVMAANLVMEHIEPVNFDEWTSHLEALFKEMNSLGVTSLKDACAHEMSLKAYRDLYQRNQMNMRIAAATRTPLDMVTKAAKGAQQTLLEQREKYACDRINPNYVKFLLDGSAGGQTLVMLEPYEGSEDYCGYHRNPLDQVTIEVERWHKEGVGVMIHAVGDGAIRGALDAIENALQKNGDTGARHQICHTTFIHPEDKPRFAENNIIAEFSPYLWFPSLATEMLEVDIGKERLALGFPVKDIIDTGAPVCQGTDCPVVESLSPWEGLESLITRKMPGGEGEAYVPDQSISLKSALKIFTLGGAYAMNQEDKTGSIEVGKFADFIVLDRNLFETPVEQIGQTQVLLTVLEGKTVHESII